MSGRGKNRAASPILSMASTATAVTATAAVKATAPEISKPEPFAGSRFKFKVFYTQIKLGI
jgi:hypothetical protein